MSEPRIIDLRSDTVTLPSGEMRRAIAEAPVGENWLAVVKQYEQDVLSKR